MKQRVIVAMVLAWAASWASAEEVALSNAHLELTVDLARCRYAVKAQDGRIVLKDAGLAVGLTRPGRQDQASRSTAVTAHTIAQVRDRLGQGRRLTLSAEDAATDCTRIYTFTVYEERPGVVMGFGLENRGDTPRRVYWAGSAVEGEVFPGSALRHPYTLNGGAGDAATVVKPQVDNHDLNSMMLTATLDSGRGTVVAGGLVNRDFIKDAGFRRDGARTLLTLRSRDPYGRRVDPGSTYLAPDRVYLDAVSRDPFEALETYGLSMRVANNVKLNMFNFPTFCGWAMSTKHLGVGRPYNHSTALVRMAEQVRDDGFTRFTPVALRLEPDTYKNETADRSTSQGWYDDAHFRRYGKLTAPYDTFAAFCSGLTEAGAIPFTYVQVNMPDTAFAKAHPDWLLAGHDQLLDKEHGREPPFRWDPTDKAFQAYMINQVWKRWADAGLVGIKHDYPQTGWFETGGFDDPYATTTSAYRKWFELCREGLGPDALIHERNLSRKRGVVAGRVFPALDTCIGVNDLQRVSKDNSHLEPEFITKIALRWYKNRVVMNYYPDCKAMTVNRTEDMPTDKRHTILTLISLVSGRLELATPYEMWTPAVKHDVSRVFPVLTTPKSFRPVDMLTGKPVPEVYVYEVDPAWSHVICFNTDNTRTQKQVPAIRRISAPFSGDQADTGSLGLKPDAEYYVYDFWKQALIGRFKGTDTLAVELSPCRATVMTVREVADHPQVISSDRHILQGQFEVSDVRWDARARTLSGKAEVVGRDPLTLTLACNGTPPRTVGADSGTARMISHDPATGLCRVTLDTTENATVHWHVRF